MVHKDILYEKKDRIAYVTLNRPKKMNAVSMLMLKELCDIWLDFEKDDNLEVAILTGAGDKAMSSGAELEDDFIKGVGDWRLRAHQSKLIDIPSPLNCGVQKPTIAAVNGICVALGLAIVAGCDIIICSENARFWDAHTNIGIHNLAVLAIARRIPWGIAMRMALTGAQEKMTAQRAYEAGLVSQVVPLSELIPTATEIAEAIMQNAPLAVRLTKESMWKSQGMPTEAALEIGDKYWWMSAFSEDAREGLRAFTEKRKPQWKGR